VFSFESTLSSRNKQTNLFLISNGKGLIVKQKRNRKETKRDTTKTKQDKAETKPNEKKRDTTETKRNGY
jgi:hypothetical protein